MTIGRANAHFLARLAMGETRAQLMARWEAGELAGLNAGFAKMWLSWMGRS